jgi:UPF0716 protein FxsA
MPFLILVFLFILMPIMEISLLIRVAGQIGILNTAAFALFTAVLGAYLVKQQGLATLAKLQQEANSGRVPAKQIVEGVALLIAGAVLLTPGFITDAVGFALLIPPLRLAIINAVARKVFANGQVVYSYTSTHGSNQQNTRQQGSGSVNGTVIDGEYTSTPDEEK